MAPGTTREEMQQIRTTVYRLPCAGFAEKDGSMTNSSRWLQWKDAALPPPGQARRAAPAAELATAARATGLRASGGAGLCGHVCDRS